MNKYQFAFMIHPLDARKDISRKYPIARYIPVSALNFMLKRAKPQIISEITGLRSRTGATANGIFVGCPLTPQLMTSLPIEVVYEKIIASAKLAEERGAKIIGLGAFTSVVGDGGITIANNLNIAVTTGNSYTVATALEGAMKAATLMDIELKNATVAVIGATGSIGRTCSIILGKKAGKIIAVGRNPEKLSALQPELQRCANAEIAVSTEVKSSAMNADIIITVSSAGMPIIEPECLKPGAVVCDVARPRDVSVRVAKVRNDVLVIEGGVVAVPGDEMDFHFNFGFPPKTAYACMSETMILALEGKYENFTLGKEISVQQVEEITALAEKHGFKLAGFRSFEKAVTEEQIIAIRENAGLKRKQLDEIVEPA